MKIIKTKFNEVIKFENLVFKDNRGYFLEIWNRKMEKMIKKKFVQENISFSKYPYTFRGLHFQKKPFQQGKLIRVLNGEIIDVLLNIDSRSINYGKILKIKLKKNEQLWIPPKYAHGFLTIKKNTLINYKVTKLYNPEKESGYSILDNKLKIFSAKLINKMILSNKDKKNKNFHEK
tara:strand:- start:2626 stop:3153 length:528 start_codon:yes stop_codon:yes gene_type:complete